MPFERGALVGIVGAEVSAAAFLARQGATRNQERDGVDVPEAEPGKTHFPALLQAISLESPAGSFQLFPGADDAAFLPRDFADVRLGGAGKQRLR